MNDPAAGSGPVTASERVLTLDVLRGFALLGILLVNIAFFAHPISQPFSFGSDASSVDRAAGWLVGFLAQGKFYPLFSLLFGLGFAIQLRRAEERGGKFVSVYMRRLLALLAIGVAHGVFIWAGDILTTYAILGVVLLLAGRGRPGRLLLLAGIAYAVQLVMVLALFWMFSFAAPCLPQGEAAGARPETCEAEGMREMIDGLLETQAEADALREAAWPAYTGGSFMDVTAVRSQEFGMMLSNMFFFGLQVFAMFLLGAWLGRQRILERPAEHRRFFRNVLVLGALGLPLSAWFASVNLEVDYTSMFDPLMAQAFLINLLAGPMLALGYVGVIVLAMQTSAAGWLSFLAPVGRMALTNYLLQSIVCTLIFYSYGFGLMAQMPGMPVQLAIVAAVFVAQIFVSHWWMRRFAHGPAEWLWRTVTYLNPPTMRQPA